MTMTGSSPIHPAIFGVQCRDKAMGVVTPKKGWVEPMASMSEKNCFGSVPRVGCGLFGKFA